MTVTYHVMWMSCALGAIAFAAVAAQSARGLTALLAGFALAAAGVSARGMPDAPIVGAVTAAAVVVTLFRPRYRLVGVAIGGMLGGLWPQLLSMQGLPSVIAWPVVVMTLATTAWLARWRPVFAPAVLLDDALLLVLALGAVLAVLPGVLEGWQSALTLNISPASGDASLPAWLVVAVGLSLLLGAAHSVWSRR